MSVLYSCQCSVHYIANVAVHILSLHSIYQVCERYRIYWYKILEIMNQKVLFKTFSFIL